MAFQRAQRFPGAQVPDLERAVVGSGHGACPVGGQGCRPDLGAMAFQRAQQRSARWPQASGQRTQPRERAPLSGTLQQVSNGTLLRGQQAAQKLPGQLRLVPGEDVRREHDRALHQEQGLAALAAAEGRVIVSEEGGDVDRIQLGLEPAIVEQQIA